MCSGAVPTTDPNELTPPRRKDIVKYLLLHGFTINIISGWGESRDHEIAKCKTILNIHGQHDETSSKIFEHIRCNRLLYADIPVLSETNYNLDHKFIDTHRTLKSIEYASFFKLTTRSKVIDCFLFYNEIEMLEYRLNALKDIVDCFIIVESTRTFTGKPKKMYFNKSRFKNLEIVHVVVDDLPFENPTKEQVWENEVFQRNAIQRGLDLINIRSDDFILISDVDEIPDPCTLNLIKIQSDLEVISQFEQDFYYYTLNNKLPDLWYSCKIFKFKLLTKSIQDLRLEVFYGIYPGGWHLSYFGTPSFIANKIQNFGHQEFNSPEFTNVEGINNRINKSIDIFDRPIKLNYIPFGQNNYLPPGYNFQEKRYCFIHSCNNGDTYRLEYLLNKLSKFLIFERIFMNFLLFPIIMTSLGCFIMIFIYKFFCEFYK